MHETQRIGDRERTSQRGRSGNRPVEAAQQVLIEGLGEEHFLAEEAVEQRHTGHGQGRDHGQRSRMRHVLPHAIDTPHVPGAGLVIDDAGGHEQRCLEGRVVDDVEDRCDGGQTRVQAEQQGDQAQMADGRIGQQSLEIVLEQRHDGTQQQRGQARHADQVEPPLRFGQGRIQTGKEEDPGLDHGRRMQERRYRRRRSHGLRQPEMERKLSGLGEHAQQYQDQRQRVQRIGTDQIARCQHGRQLEASDDVADQQDAGEQRQPSATSHRQCHARALTSIGPMVPVADQEE